MSRWTHNICVPCWRKQRHEHPVPEDHIPVNADDDFCCFCGHLNKDGIYVRHDPNDLPCKGVHPNF